MLEKVRGKGFFRSFALFLSELHRAWSLLPPPSFTERGAIPPSPEKERGEGFLLSSYGALRVQERVELKK